jgi:hypothetical protein
MAEPGSFLGMESSFGARPSTNPVLRYIAILRAAREFGVAPADIEEVAQRFDPRTARPRDIADALADKLPADRRALRAV